MTIQQKSNHPSIAGADRLQAVQKRLVCPDPHSDRFMTENHPFASRHLVAVLNYLELV